MFIECHGIEFIRFAPPFCLVYASYSDVTAEDFLHVQTNTTYRKQWDNSAVALDVIDIDPKNVNKSHVVYWEMRWPVITQFLN